MTVNEKNAEIFICSKLERSDCFLNRLGNQLET